MPRQDVNYSNAHEFIYQHLTSSPRRWIVHPTNNPSVFRYEYIDPPDYGFQTTTGDWAPSLSALKLFCLERIGEEQLMHPDPVAAKIQQMSKRFADRKALHG